MCSEGEMGTPAGRRKQRHGREGGTDERDRGQRGRRKLRRAGGREGWTKIDLEDLFFN